MWEAAILSSYMKKLFRWLRCQMFFDNKIFLLFRHRQVELRRDSVVNYTSQCHFLFHFHHRMRYCHRHCQLLLAVEIAIAGTVDSDAIRIKEKEILVKKKC